MHRSQSKNGRSPLIPVGIHTPAGMFIARFSERGLAELDFPRRYAQEPQTDLGSLGGKMQQWIRTTGSAVLSALSGEPVRVLPPLDLSVGTDFQQRVWAILRSIKPGETRSYSHVAAELGTPKAARAVGAACGANPIPLLIPCHRVLTAGAKLGGFSGGLDWKLRLLAAEGVTPSN